MKRETKFDSKNQKYLVNRNHMQTDRLNSAKQLLGFIENQIKVITTTSAQMQIDFY